MTLRLQKRQVNRLAARLALAMLVADLAGRARVLLEVERDTGLRFGAATGLSFEESRGGWADSSLATDAAPAIFSYKEFESAGGRDALPVSSVLVEPKKQSDRFAEEGEAQVLAPKKLEPKAALDFFRQKLAMTRVAFDKLGKRYREAAFTVADVESVRLIEEIQAELDRALAQGLTRAQFQAAVDARFKTAGLSPLDPFHLETVFRTNVASAYSAGRASQMLQPDVRRALPYWEYRTVGDSRVRNEHAVLNGFVARWDDPVWSRIYPPNGYNCRCKVRALLERQARERAAKSGQDLDRPGAERMPEGAEIDFDSSPVQTLTARAAGREASGPDTSRPRVSAKEITAKALKVRERAAKEYLAAEEEKSRTLAEVGEKRGRALLRAVYAAEDAELRLRRVKAEFNRKIHGLVKPPEPRTYRLHVRGEVDGKRVAAWERGLREAGRLIGVGPEAATIHVELLNRKRSAYSPKLRRLRMGRAGEEKSVVHEMGHWLEHVDPRVGAAAREFLERRTKGEPLVRLTDRYPGRGYRAAEVAREDEFLELYMGKIYGRDGATEIVPMGLQWMWERPFDLLADEEYFGFIVALLRGEGL